MGNIQYLRQKNTYYTRRGKIYYISLNLEQINGSFFFYQDDENPENRASFDVAMKTINFFPMLSIATNNTISKGMIWASIGAASERFFESHVRPANQLFFKMNQNLKLTSIISH